jgi:hypothetical protein
MAAVAAPEPGTAARELILTRATRLLAGPHGLASWLRTRLTTGPAATISQPLDIGIPTEVIPPHLRRAVILRDRHCAFPGCHRPPAGCHVHHIVPRSEGGVTRLDNCVLLCDAPSTTSSRSTAGAGTSGSTPTAPQPPLAPTARAPSTATARPPRRSAAKSPDEGARRVERVLQD